MRQPISSSFRHAGFTVFELLAVVAVIVLLIAMSGMSPRTLREEKIRGQVSRVRNDHRSMATTLENYHADHNKSYPAMRSFTSYPGVDTKRLRDANGAGLSFVEPGWGGMPGLTTPTAYLPSLFADPFAPTKGMPSAYWVPDDGKGWILISPGPDRVYGLTPEVLKEVYDPTHALKPSARLLAGGGPNGAFTWDPTNGVVSEGDVWRVKP